MRTSPAPSSPPTAASSGQWTTSGGTWRFATAVADVDARYIDFLVAYEDKRFRGHFGVDPLAVGRALVQWAESGHVVSGASTLTMQAARLLAPRRRTLAAKLLEMARAVQLERRYSKDRILSIYLTLAPFGGNLEGVRAASLAYFGKEPKSLSVAEAALLVGLPQAPSAARPDRYPAKALARRAKVLDRLAGSAVLSPRQAAEAKGAPAPSRRHAFPFAAPHLARRLLAAQPAEVTLNTHIDAALQARVQDILAAAAGGLGAEVNAAALVVDTASAQVIAYGASSTFFDARRAGQIDYVRALRSPGSTLKPFIYAMAFEAGVVHPETILGDRGQRFGAYRPTNFGGRRHGQVTARFALQASLNTPAVGVLGAVGPNRVLARLADAGIAPRYRPGGNGPGLALALGGVGMTLEQLVALYAAIARGGEFRALSLTGPAGPGARSEVLDAAAARLVAGILRGTPRPRGRPAGNARLAFKTGTSWGFRDAWSIGFDASHTVGVWVGRADGMPMPGQTGMRTAAPLLFRIFDLLPGAVADAAPGRPPGSAPANLRRLDATFHVAKAAPGTLAIAFPVDGSVIRLGGGVRSIPIRIEGGRRPFHLFVNAAPLSRATRKRTIAWPPDGAGFYEIMALDAGGATARVTVELAPRAGRRRAGVR